MYFYSNKKKYKTGLKRKCSEVFSEDLGTCTKVKAKFEIKENATPVFSPKRSVAFSALDPINKELERRFRGHFQSRRL